MKITADIQLALISGATASGKTTQCIKIVKEFLENGGKAVVICESSCEWTNDKVIGKYPKDGDLKIFDMSKSNEPSLDEMGLTHVKDGSKVLICIDGVFSENKILETINNVVNCYQNVEILVSTHRTVTNRLMPMLQDSGKNFLKFNCFINENKEVELYADL